MITLNAVKAIATKSAGRSGLFLSKNSPEIMLGLGVAGIVVGTVLACKATLKAKEILDETKRDLGQIDHVKNMPEVSYSQEDAQKDTAILYIQTGVKLAREYAPAIILTTISIGLILQSHNLLSKRNAALVAAYKLVDASFKEYRKRVIDEYGEEVDRKLRFGQREIEITKVDGKGKEKKSIAKVLGTNDISPYSFVFDESTSTQYQKNYDLNLFLLKSVQNYANDTLRSRGHIFLNEILDSLGMHRTTAGALVGWVYGYNSHNENNDHIVVFGLDDPVNEEMQDAKDAMYQPFYLNFNVDGIIYDQI